LTVIISTWNSKRYLEGCLESLLSLEITNLETIVVDSASTDGTPEYLTEMSVSNPKLNLRPILVKRRVFWTEANEIGIEHSAGKWICLSNPDIVFNATFRILLDYCFSHEDAVVAPQLIHPDGRPQLPVRLLGPRYLVVYSYAGKFLLRILRRDYGFQTRYISDGSPVKVDHPMGSLFIVSRRTLEMIGGRLWNRGYLNGVTDSDAFYNLKVRKIPVFILPTCRLVHFSDVVYKRGSSWKDYDCWYGMILYLRYWRMKPIRVSVVFAMESVVSLVLSMALRIFKPHVKAKYSPRERVRVTFDNLRGIVDAWRFKV
jgi:glycosyltransferase involved in cell wall biosynthesis